MHSVGKCQRDACRARVRDVSGVRDVFTTYQVQGTGTVDSSMCQGQVCVRYRYMSDTDMYVSGVCQGCVRDVCIRYSMCQTCVRYNCIMCQGYVRVQG